MQSQCLAIWDSLFAVPWVTTAHGHVLVHVGWLAVEISLHRLPSLSITVMSRNDTLSGDQSVVNLMVVRCCRKSGYFTPFVYTHGEDIINISPPNVWFLLCFSQDLAL